MGFNWRSAGVACVGAVLFTSGLTACGSDDGASKKGTETIRIMVSAPLSGDSAATGQDIVDGAQFAADYLNDKGGVGTGDLKGAIFEITGADDGQSTEGATTIASKFVGDEDAFALMGYLSSSQAQAAAAVAQRARLGVFSTYSCADYLHKEADNVVIMCTDNYNIGRAAANFAGEVLQAKSVALIGGDYSFLDSYRAGIKAEADELGLSVVTDQAFPGGTSNFSPMVTTLKSKAADVILSGGFQAEAGRIVAQADRAGLDTPMVDFLAEGWGSAYMEVAGKAAIGTIGQYAGEVYGAEGFAAEIAAGFVKEFGRPITGAALHAFDTVLTINAAIEAGASTREELLSFVPKAEGEGTVGEIAFDEELRPMSRNGVFAEITGPEAGDKKVLARYRLGVSSIERIN